MAFQKKIIQMSALLLVFSMISSPIVTMAETLSSYENDGNSSSVDSTTSNSANWVDNLTQSTSNEQQESKTSEPIKESDLIESVGPDQFELDSGTNQSLLSGELLPPLEGVLANQRPTNTPASFRKYIQIDENGRPLSGGEHIPPSIVFANSHGTGILLDGLDISNTPISTRHRVNKGSVIRYISVGEDEFGNTLDGIVTLLTDTQLTVNNTGVIHHGGTGIQATVHQIEVKIVRASDDSIVNAPVWTSYTNRSSVQTTTVLYSGIQILDSKLESIISQVFPPVNGNNNVMNRDLAWGTFGDTVKIGSSRLVGNSGTSAGIQFNVITTDGAFVLAVPMLSSTEQLQLFRQQGTALDMNFSNLSVLGEIEDNVFKSKYSVSQKVPAFSVSGLDIQIENPDVLMGEDVSILSIEDDSGTDLTGQATIEKKDQELMISFAQETIEALREKTITIELEYPIDKTKQVEDYLEGDYLAIDLLATNSRSAVEATGTAQTWARPWGEAVHQEIGLDTSTSELDPADFVTALENKLEGDEPFAVGFSEERTFDTLGETSIGVVIESEISGIQNIIDVPVTVVENKGTVLVHHVDTEGNTLAESDELIGKVGEAYETQPKEIEHYRVKVVPENATGLYTEEDTDVTYIYEVAPVSPVDPMDPDTETTPENGPTIPEGQGLVSLDFVSQFNFGEVAIHAGAKQYEALPQQITSGETLQSRPNYVQISDRRETNDRGGWSLMATLSTEGFRNEDNEELRGASIQLANQELAKPSANAGRTPQIVRNNGATLLPGVATRLLDASAAEGQGTWVYRFGDQDSAGSSVKLDVPAGANPKATNYQATINWELSVVPGND